MHGFKILTPVKWQAYIVALIGMLVFSSCSQPNMVNDYLRTGNKHYTEKNYDSAMKYYLKAIDTQDKNFEGHFGLGDALFQKKDFTGALSRFESASSVAETNQQKAIAYYNTGNTKLLIKDLEPAIDAYKMALKNNPYDKDAKYNLSVALARRPKKETDPNKDKNKKQNKKENKPEKKQDEKKEDFAAKLKAMADALVKQNKYSEALQLMEDGLKKDPSVQQYADFIKRLNDIVQLDTQ